MLLGDAHVEVAIRQEALQLVERGTFGHGRRNPDDRRITPGELHERIAEHLLVVRRRTGLLFQLTRFRVVRTRAVELGRIILGELPAAPLLGDHLNEDWPGEGLGLAEDLDQVRCVVSVERAQERKTELLENHPALAGQPELLGAAHSAAGHLPRQRAPWYDSQRSSDHRTETPQ